MSLLTSCVDKVHTASGKNKHIVAFVTFNLCSGSYEYGT